MFRRRPYRVRSTALLPPGIAPRAVVPWGILPLTAGLLATGLLAAGLGLSGCASGDASLGVVDPEAVPESPTFEQAFAIVQRECASCHDDGGPSPAYHTCRDLVTNVDQLVTTALTENSMPPGAWPRLNSRDRLVLSRWIAQGAESPCGD